MKNRKGFTIVELVIVIAVIAILAAVLIPTFTTVTANARASAALSQAKNAQTAVLGNTEGTMPDNTLFAVTNDNDPYAEYVFAIVGRKLEQQKLDSVNSTSAYPATDADGAYTVFVTADYFDDTKGTTTLRSNVEKLVADILDRKLSALTKEGQTDKQGVLAANTTPIVGATYYKWTYTAKGATDPVDVIVYYNGDIPETCVAFVG